MLRRLMIGVLAGATFAGTALAADQFGTAAEAKALLEKAVAELKANEAAAKAFRTVMRPTICAATELNATRGGTIVAGTAWSHRPEATSAVPNPARPVT